MKRHSLKDLLAGIDNKAFLEAHRKFAKAGISAKQSVANFCIALEKIKSVTKGKQYEEIDNRSNNPNHSDATWHQAGVI